MQPKEPRKLSFSADTFTKKALEELVADGYADAWAFDGHYVRRVIGLAGILKRMLDSSDHGKVLSIDSALTSELKTILSAACYLFNSASFREGEYYEFDKLEVDRKLRRK